MPDNPSIEAGAEEQSPADRRSWLPIILRAWQPEAPSRQRPPGLIPGAAVVDQQPADRRAWLPTVRQSWEPPPPLPWQGWQVHPSIEAVAEDAPPVGRRFWLPTILEAWAPGAPFLRRPQRLGQETPATGNIEIDVLTYGAEIDVPIQSREVDVSDDSREIDVPKVTI